VNVYEQSPLPHCAQPQHLRNRAHTVMIYCSFWLSHVDQYLCHLAVANALPCVPETLGRELQDVGLTDSCEIRFQHNNGTKASDVASITVLAGCLCLASCGSAVTGSTQSLLPRTLAFRCAANEAINPCSAPRRHRCGRCGPVSERQRERVGIVGET
jgi:hypothetical protein